MGRRTGRSECCSQRRAVRSWAGEDACAQVILARDLLPDVVAHSLPPTTRRSEDSKRLYTHGGSMIPGGVG